MEKGDLVPDELICKVIMERVDRAEAADGFLLDGFPRTIPQAEVLEEALERRGRQLTAALLIEAPDEEVIRRLSGRRICTKNGHLYHVDFDPPKHEGVCDQDGSPLIQRDDDKPETVKHRLEVYHEQTTPLIDCYESAGSCAASTGRARRKRCTTTSARRSPRCGSKKSLARDDHQEDPEEIDKIAAAGDILARCLTLLSARRAPGVTTAELDEAAERFIRSQGAEPAFKGYRGFPGSICASPELDGRPRHPGPVQARARRHPVDRRRRGLDGWVADAAITLPIGPVSPIAARLLEVTTRGALRRRRAVPARQPPRRRLARGPEPRRGGRLLGDPLARRPRDRPRHARGPADPQLRRARHRARARGGHGPGDRADGQRGRRTRSGWRPTTGRSTPRTARWRPISSTPSRSPPRGRGSSPRGTCRGGQRASRAVTPAIFSRSRAEPIPGLVRCNL